METTKKLPNEITVRLSLTFQDSPEIHTLLAMTPTRERVKLVRLALERFIVGTGHPAGNPDVQLQAISKWLTARKESLSVPSDTLATEKNSLHANRSSPTPQHDLPTALAKDEPKSIVETRPNASQTAGISSSKPGTSETFNRWLNT